MLVPSTNEFDAHPRIAEARYQTDHEKGREAVA
jgi:hypothetical protein